MKITILCSSKDHRIYPYLEDWKKKHSNLHEISLVNNIQDVTTGDILFLISVTEIVKQEVRNRFKHSLVIHGSDLPEGRGWSPIVWQIIHGSDKFTVTLFEAVDQVDAGDVWKKQSFTLEGHELYNEINEKLFETELALMDFALKNSTIINPIPQPKANSSYFKRRKSEDSELDPQKTIAEQFDLMRVADPNRFPLFFTFRGHKYKIFLQKS